MVFTEDDDFCNVAIPVLRRSGSMFTNCDACDSTPHGGGHTILCCPIVIWGYICTVTNRYEDRGRSNTFCRRVSYNSSRIPVSFTIKSGKVIISISVAEQKLSIGVTIKYSAIPIVIRFRHGIDGVCVLKDEGGGNQMVMGPIKAKNLQAIQPIGYRGRAASSSTLSEIVSVSALIFPSLYIPGTKLYAIRTRIGCIEPQARGCNEGGGFHDGCYLKNR